MNYTNIYLNTEYSILSSTCRISQICELAKSYGYDSLAITDNGNMHGVIKFYKECQKNNLKPIIGLKIQYQYNDETANILLYAMNNLGYQNLMKICSIGKINQDKMDLNLLSKYAFGIICVIPSSEHYIYHSLINNSEVNKGLSHYRLLENIFSKVFLGISKTNSFERTNYHQIVKVGLDNHLSMIGMVKTSMISPDDLKVLNVLKIIKGTKENTPSLEIQNICFPTLEELEKEFKDYPFLLENTSQLASLCDVHIEFGLYQHPKYQEGLDEKRYLTELCYAGLKKRLEKKYINQFIYQKYFERLNYELSIIINMGYSDYFLIVWDFIKYAKTNNIMVGPGRGSAAASLVAYSLGITNIDPIEYNLIFERFLNPERVSMPDIDTDFQDDRRDEVIRYVGKRYSKDRVAHIVTFGCFAVKSALRETAKALNLSETRLSQINKYINNDGDQTIEKNLQENEEIINLANTYSDIKEVLTIAAKIEGLPRNTSTHAAGIVITKDDLVLSTPVEEGLDDIYQTQYASDDLEALGLLKMDFLGLINLTNIQRCIKMIQEFEPNFKLPTVYDDQKTYQLIKSGDVKGIFQIEKEGMKKTLMNLNANSINEIAQAIALYRPGPMKMIPTFINRKFGYEKVNYLHPDLIPILKDTYGTIIYQEQILSIARKFAGFSFGKADLLRRAISKKNKNEMIKMKNDFIESTINNGYEESIAKEIFEYIEKFADYGFNKAHSISYAVVCYYTAYLKANYYPYYLAVLMSADSLSEEHLKEYIKALQKRKIKLREPNINESDQFFKVKQNEIILPLTKITGINDSKAKEIINKRPFSSYQDFIEKTADFLTFSNIENIIYSSALDCFQITKKAMIDNYLNIVNRMKYNHIGQLLEITYENDEFEYGFLLEKEKSSIGINIVYNLFYQFKNYYQSNYITKIQNIKPNGTYTTIGIIKDIHEIKTKNNEKMAFATLEDDNDKIELVIFTRIYENMEIDNNNFVEVQGNTQISKNNELQLIIKNIRKI